MAPSFIPDLHQHYFSFQSINQFYLSHEILRGTILVKCYPISAFNLCTIHHKAECDCQIGTQKKSYPVKRHRHFRIQPSLGERVKLTVRSRSQGSITSRLPRCPLWCRDGDGHRDGLAFPHSHDCSHRTLLIASFTFVFTLTGQGSRISRRLVS